jgi:ketosteroid isomerase-like protein
MTIDTDAILDRWLAAVFGGDKAALAAMMDPGFELHQSPALPYGGVLKGPEGFDHFWRSFGEAFEVEALDEVDRFRSDGGAIVLKFHFRGRAKASGKPFDTTILESFYFRDGKVLSIAPHWFELP